MSTPGRDVEAIFTAALGRTTPAERAAYLDGACGKDDELRRRVEALLRAHEAAGSFLDESAVMSTASEPAPADPTDRPLARPTPRPRIEGPGDRIGPYRLLQQIGEGGMGTVYMAEQEKPVRRRVALKIIKAGMDTGQVVARFEAERQALALMDHQNIARVLDAGTTDSGRPYFVMELVHGVAITKYCDDAQLTPRARLELFVPVCQAIQHAHQKGILHRDVKPSNILVTLYDGKPVAKVIDFGIAKAVDQRLTERTMFTQFGAIVGTLEYMSPEQAEMSALGVDTRSDIYSLGVLLYELLTGTTPLERWRLREAGYDEILKRIKEEDPPKPSTRLSESRDTLPSISAQRNTEPSKLRKLLRGELDWIVMKALEKDRTRRYESASGFARDIERFLNDETVEACPPSAGYRLRKFARKHRAALATTAAFAALLLIGALVSTVLAFRAGREALRAVAAEHQIARERDRAVAAEAQAKVESTKAKRAADEAEAVLTFFQDQVLAAARPEGQDGGLGKDVTIRKAVDAAEPKITGAFKDQPTVEASIRDALGLTYRDLGEAMLAIRQHERSMALRKERLGTDDQETLKSQNHLASAYYDAGQLDRAIPLHERTLASRRARLGPDHPDTLISQRNLGEGYHAAGKLKDAIALLEKTLTAQAASLGTDHPATLKTQNSLARAYASAGELDRTIALLERTAAALAAKLGPEHPSTLASQGDLASAYVDAERLDQAFPLIERTLGMCTAKLGPDHPATLACQDNLARAYMVSREYDRAIALHERTLAAGTAKLGPDHPATLNTQKHLAHGYSETGRFDRAIPLLERTLATCAAKLGPDHPDTLDAQNSLAVVYEDARLFDRSISLHKQTLAALTAKLGADHPSTQASRFNLAGAYTAAGQYDLAIPLFEQTLAEVTAKPAADRLSPLPIQYLLAQAYQGRGESPRAEVLLREAVATQKKEHGPEHPIFASALSMLGQILLKDRKWAEAESLLRECLAIREAKMPDNWSTFDARSMLGGSLLGQKIYPTAEPLLVTGYEGLKAREAKIPVYRRHRLPDAAERIVQLYEAWGKPEQAAEWRKQTGTGPAKWPEDMFARP